MKVHVWRPRHGHTRFGWYLNRWSKASNLTISLRWLLIRVIW
jgi:hypothetical protein